jgi:putative salt-induced outer membrane protein YdiY
MKSVFATVGAVCLLTGIAITDDRIELTSGDVLIGTVVEQTDDHVVLAHPILGQITVATGDVAAMMLADAPDVEPIAPEPEPPAWEREIDLGLSGASGNTDFFNLRAAIRATRETDLHRWRFDTAFYYGEEDGERNQTRATAGVLKDWLFTDSPWLVFVQGRFDFDDFRSWTYRVSGHGGVGYTFLDDDTFQLIGRLGAGASKQWKRTESIKPEGLIGGEFRWNIDDRQRLTAHSTLYPQLDDFFEFRLVSGVAWTMSLDRGRGLNLSAGIEHEHESTVDQGFKHNDFRFYAGLTFAF